MLQGFPVDGLIRSHLCGPACWFRLTAALLLEGVVAEVDVVVVDDVVGAAAVGRGGELRCASLRCFCNFAAVSKRAVQLAEVHVYEPVAAAASDGRGIPGDEGERWADSALDGKSGRIGFSDCVVSLLDDSIEVSVGKSRGWSVVLRRLLLCLCNCAMKGYVCGICMLPGTDGGMKVMFDPD